MISDRTSGELLREARRRLGISQRELARRAETSQSALAAYEAGRKAPALPTLQRILRAAGFALDLDLVPLTAEAADPGGLRRRLLSHRNEILDSANRHGASNVRVFGSVARGDYTAGSDYDLLVDTAPGQGLLEHAGLILELEEILGAHVDVVSSAGLLDGDDDIRNEAVAL